jgi:hypothetical protein
MTLFCRIGELNPLIPVTRPTNCLGKFQIQNLDPVVVDRKPSSRTTRKSPFPSSRRETPSLRETRRPIHHFFGMITLPLRSTFPHPVLPPVSALTNER